jgi:hypothetical protein
VKDARNALLISDQKKENPMKSTLIRVMSIMTLASSMTALALPEKDNHPNCGSAEGASSPATATPGKGQSDNGQDKAREMQIRDQEKQWLHDFQNMVAG